MKRKITFITYDTVRHACTRIIILLFLDYIESCQGITIDGICFVWSNCSPQRMSDSIPFFVGLRPKRKYLFVFSVSPNSIDFKWHVFQLAIAEEKHCPLCHYSGTYMWVFSPDWRLNGTTWLSLRNVRNSKRIKRFTLLVFVGRFWAHEFTLSTQLVRWLLFFNDYYGRTVGWAIYLVIRRLPLFWISVR